MEPRGTPCDTEKHLFRKTDWWFLFNTIEMMLRLLRPISPGIINPEVDYTLLITMIRSLLDFAKLSCSQYGSGSEWATVDGLFAEVDLLGMLVASPQTCAMLPTEPLRGQSLQSALSTLRENLLRSELWTLALEVSTKAGLDYNSVWLAWGKSCLKAGAWTEARDKFAHCNPHKKDTQMLSDIMQILQDNPQLTDLKSRLGRLKMLSTKQETLHTNQGLEPRVYEECLYYLRTYGSYATTLSFYLNQNDIKSAVCLLLEGAVDLQVYLENLFLPALQSGRVTEMYTCMASIDKTFTVFKEYLRVSCAYCERHQLFHVLYQVQVLTGDHVRAALTCIHFFRHNARNYGDLATTKGHLETAVGHLQQALKPTKEPKNPLVMQLSGQDLTRYLSTARLQLEVVVFLASSTPEVASYTLFGSSAHRVSLAAAVIAAGDDLEQSLALATRVTEDWQQGKPAVLCPAAAQLVRTGRASVVRRLVTLFRSEPELCNELLITALKERPQQSDIDTLMALVTGVPSKITAMIECGQLKSAYLLAVKHDRLSDIQRIMEAADQLGQPLIKKICLKRLNIPDES
ncbi:Zinc finger FYVE domain-containing protein 26 [Homalodisca vitripennis]|nr:Zinc finger FYVE domain-containing protein 26 [Homalodisca vitripennis]